MPSLTSQRLVGASRRKSVVMAGVGGFEPASVFAPRLAQRQPAVWVGPVSATHARVELAPISVFADETDHPTLERHRRSAP